MKILNQFYTLICLLIFFSYINLFAQLPPIFNDQLVSDHWGYIVGLTFDENGRMYVWDKAGKVFLIEDGKLLEEPLIDISEEVLHHGDHGMLGFALHPNFLNNGYFYLLYVVDQHHLLEYGKSTYSPDITEVEVATIGRVTRYTADPASNFTQTLEGSRKVLLGESVDTGFPILHKSHGVGSLVFGTDGTLLVSCGDGGSYVNTGDFGSHSDTYFEEALALGIITPEEDLGAYRSQMRNSLNGKILRIDPNTGDGIPSNPFYEPTDPRAAKSRVWVLGLRNPYRFSLKPQTGSHSPEDGNPGTLYIGDVGWGEWEEINVSKKGGENFGWPIYEGNIGRWHYYANKRSSPEAPNPLFGQNACDKEFLDFHDLIAQETPDGTFSMMNPCKIDEPIPVSLPVSMHVRPMLAWSNKEFNVNKQGAEVPGFDANGEAIIFDLDAPDSPVEGEGFSGSCTVGGVFYTANNFPQAYHMEFIAGDFPGWMKKLSYDEDDKLTRVSTFMEEVEDLNIVHMEVNPVDGCLYYISYGLKRELRRICYGGNPPPVSVLEYDKLYGPTPLEVQFKGDASYDPDNQPLSWFWEFGDGTTSTEMNPVHTFEAPQGTPTPFEVKLSVSDSLGLSHTSYVTISLNNTPPEITLTSFADGDLYTSGKKTILPLTAEIEDAEHSEKELSYAWQAFLHHNTHYHPEPPDENRFTKINIGGEGCGDEVYWYRVGLSVTDAAGLTTYVEGELFPYCDEPLTVFDEVVAIPNSDFILLEWQSIRETTNTEFIIEKAGEDKIYTPIGTVKGSNSSYSFSDFNPLDGKNYYRIAARSIPGLKEYSEELAVSFPPPPPIHIYPNPAKDFIRIDFLHVVTGETVELKIYNIIGEELLSEKASSEILQSKSWQIETQALLPGVYIYNLERKNEKTTGKIIITTE